MSALRPAPPSPGPTKSHPGGSGTLASGVAGRAQLATDRRRDRHGTRHLVNLPAGAVATAPVGATWTWSTTIGMCAGVGMAPGLAAPPRPDLPSARSSGRSASIQWLGAHQHTDGARKRASRPTSALTRHRSVNRLTQRVVGWATPAAERSRRSACGHRMRPNGTVVGGRCPLRGKAGGGYGDAGSVPVNTPGRGTATSPAPRQASRRGSTPRAAAPSMEEGRTATPWPGRDDHGRKSGPRRQRQPAWPGSR